MRRRRMLCGTAAFLGTSLAVAPRRTSAHEGDEDGDGTVAGTPGEGYDPLGVVDLPGATEAVVGTDRTVYVATGDGYASVDVSNPTSPRVLARRTGLREGDENGPLVNIQDVKVDGDTLVVAGPAHPRRNTLAGLVVVDVSDPADPVERGFFSTEYPIHNCDLVDGRAYLTGNDGDRNALVVVDVEDDPVELGQWSLLDADEGWDDVSSNRRTLHDVTVHDGLAVCAMWDAGTWLVDVTDPTAMTALGNVETPAVDDLDAGPEPAVTAPGNHHYATLDETGTLLAVGKETFGVRTDDDSDSSSEEFVGGPSGVDLWDVSDLDAPVKRSTIHPPQSADPTFGGTWTTAHNLDMRDEILYTSWYQGGVKRHDVSTSGEPREESWWLAPGETSFWTAQAVTTGSDGFFVASSRGVDDVPGRLYTFPNRAGTQADPPSIDREAPTETAGDVTTVVENSRTGSGSTASAPGFGVGAGLAALSLSGWWLRRRESE